MSFTHLGLGLDLLIVFLMVFTIYYALRLSKMLSAFRADRENLQAVIVDLNGNIERAQKVLSDLRNAAEDPEGTTKDLVENSKALLSELNTVNDVGNSLADRLQRLAEESREAVMNEAPQKRKNLEMGAMVEAQSFSQNPVTQNNASHKSISNNDVEQDNQRAPSMRELEQIKADSDIFPHNNTSSMSYYDKIKSDNALDKPSRAPVDTDSPSFAIQDRDFEDDASEPYDPETDGLSQAEKDLYKALNKNI